MRIRRVVTILFLAASMMLLAPRNAHAGYARHYDVYDACLGPCCYLAGQWDLDCDGNWTGWGAAPGDPCTNYYMSFTDYCGPDH